MVVLESQIYSEVDGYNIEPYSWLEPFSDASRARHLDVFVTV